MAALNTLSVAMTTVGGAWSLIAFGLAFAGFVLLIVADAGRILGLDGLGANLLFLVPVLLAWGFAGYRFHQGTVTSRQLPDEC